MRKHFVEFFSPGTFLSESSQRAIESWDTKTAATMATEITERYNAKPYGFKFFTSIAAESIDDGEGGKLNVQPKEIARSGMYYLTGDLILFDDAPKGTLRSNMRCNHWPICIENKNSWRFTGTFGANDFIVDKEGNTVRRGNDADLVEYRAKKIAEWNSHDSVE